MKTEKERPRRRFRGRKRGRKGAIRPMVAGVRNRQNGAAGARTDGNTRRGEDRENGASAFRPPTNGGGNCSHKQKVSTSGRGVRTLWMSAAARRVLTPLDVLPSRPYSGGGAMHTVAPLTMRGRSGQGRSNGVPSRPWHLQDLPCGRVVARHSDAILRGEALTSAGGTVCERVIEVAPEASYRVSHNTFELQAPSRDLRRPVGPVGLQTYYASLNRRTSAGSEEDAIVLVKGPSAHGSRPTMRRP